MIEVQEVNLGVHPELFMPLGIKSVKERCAALVTFDPDATVDEFVVIEHVVEVPNMADDPERHFVLKGEELKKAIMGRYPDSYQQAKVVGNVHTHWMGGPDPSFDDVQNATELVNAVYHPSKRRLTFYSKDEGYLAHVTLPRSTA